jgi:hypothetical protein
MTSFSSRAIPSAGTEMGDLKWSPAEKVIARKAFNLALGRELQSVILEAKCKAAKIQEPSGLWELEQYLTQRRSEIDRMYDYRYSVLPLVLANSLPVAAWSRMSCSAFVKTSSPASSVQLCIFGTLSLLAAFELLKIRFQESTDMHLSGMLTYHPRDSFLICRAPREQPSRMPITLS